MEKRWCFILLSSLLLFIQTGQADDDHDHAVSDKKVTTTEQQKVNQGNEGLIKISPEGQQAANIKTEVLNVKSLPIYVSAPGEVIPNKDLTTIVTPRIQAQVVQRLVKIGEHVKKGQLLARLSSVDMAKAQANLLLTQKEWVRVKQLGKQAVSAKRYQIAEIAYQQAYSKLLAYGMTRAQIEAFLKSDDPNKANGEFALLAQRGGTIFSADFTEGQMIEPGTILYKIVDEMSLWVDANLANGESDKIKKGAKAIIQTAHHKLPAEVLQIHHKLDEITRTRIVRLKVFNPQDQLHPGEFVTCLIQTGETQPVLAVHQTTLMRIPDGNQAIYIEVSPNYFRAKEVQVVQKIGSWRVIRGIKAGTRIVTKGAFFVHAESLKSGFSTHNH